jgi:hypothetical protein|tara:strand:+ start:840 stop:1097 length:258 start_codon:yes stop_codon:yes gene_type:complete
MAIQTDNNGGFVITGDDTSKFRLLTLHKALILETKGMKLSRNLPSVYSTVKKEYGFKGSKVKVLAQFESMLIEEYELPITRHTAD